MHQSIHPLSKEQSVSSTNLVYLYDIYTQAILMPTLL